MKIKEFKKWHMYVITGYACLLSSLATCFVMNSLGVPATIIQRVDFWFITNFYYTLLLALLGKEYAGIKEGRYGTLTFFLSCVIFSLLGHYIFTLIKNI